MLSSEFFKKEIHCSRDFFFFRDCAGIKRGEYERMRRMYEKKPTIIEDLAFLSVKYGVSLSGLFHALVEAKQNKKSTCENLVIDHRGTINDEEIFLIKRDGNVIVQFRIAKEHLLGEDLHIEGWMNSDRIQRELARQSCKPNAFTAIQDLRHGMKRVNVEAEVLENSKPSLVHTRFGNNAMVANALIADDTGKVKLCLWNEQVKYVALGNTIQIRNASVTAFKGERQLRLGKNGTLTVLAN
ncbi:MAG TPA: hypothetical protein VK209_12540 [Candidatus Sulfotelmatobacter sp.]|nr:hypothetical protein [Candidatus Sulfotelmatobacter sp.]